MLANRTNFFTTEFTEIAESDESTLTGKVIGAAIDVHRTLGPGLLEAAVLFKAVKLQVRVIN